MIVVFCELGGHGLLAKAREIADTTGDRVSSLIARGSFDPQQLISFGADQVQVYDVTVPSDWINIVVGVLRENNPKHVLFPSNIISNMIMSAVYLQCKDRVSSYLDEADGLEGTIVAKSLWALGLSLQKRCETEKCALVSLKLSSLPEPFEDSFRYGSVSSPQMKSESSKMQISSPSSSIPHSSSSKLTILTGPRVSARTIDLSKRLADNYRGISKRISGSIEAVYGPCIAIEVDNRRDDLPVFNGELISISSKEFPVNLVADVEIVSQEIEAILEGLLS